MGGKAKFWDRVARRYANSPIKNVAAYEATLQQVRNHLSDRDYVLEMGCGTGTTALALADSVTHVTACDLSGAMIEIALEKAQATAVSNVRFTQATVGTDDCAPASIDAVLAFNLLHLLRDPDAAAKRAHTVLRSGGVFISKTVCLAERSWLLRLALPPMRLIGVAPYVAFLNRGDLEKIMVNAGFEIAECMTFEDAPTSWFIVARKT